MAEFQLIGDMIAEVLTGLEKNGAENNGAVESAVKAKVLELTAKFPLYDQPL